MALLTEIIDWAQNKPAFWQAGIDRLIRNNTLTAADMAELKNICKAEAGIINYSYTPVNFVALHAHINSIAANANLVLSRIYGISNINALSNTNVLEFHPSGLSVIYGDNGSGKSSYVSILKHVCNTRGPKPSLNDNLYIAGNRGTNKEAFVEFTENGTTFSSIALRNGEISHGTLKGVDVFDSASAHHYIADEDEIAFIPHGLSLIEKFAKALKEIETALSIEVQALNLAPFDVRLLQIDQTSTAGQFIHSLNQNTTFDQLRAQCDFNATKDTRIVELRRLIAELIATDPQAAIGRNSGQINRLQILRNKLAALETSLYSETVRSEVQLIGNTYLTTLQALQAASDTTFSSLPLTQIGGASWKLLWESARKFYNEGKKAIVFPEIADGSSCPLCMQELSPEAQRRFTDFEAFVQHDTQQQHDTAVSARQAIINRLIRLSFDFTEQAATITELASLIENYVTLHDQYLEQLVAQKDYLIKLLEDQAPIVTVLSPEITNNVKELIDGHITRLQEENQRLQALSIANELRPLETELLQLTNEKKIFDFKHQLAKEIVRHKKMALLNAAGGNCNTRTVTTLSNHLTATYITQQLRDKFQEELRGLGFTNIKVETETKGVRGKQYHKLRLNELNADGIALKDILSEGEHRCIALSTFLSELALSDHHSAIVFDDPVSSLDHKWRNKIAKRIVQESAVRQVIVFTHDITFLLMLGEHAEKLSATIDVKSLTRKRQETGILVRNPPWDALSVRKRIGILKNQQQQIASLYRTATEEEYTEGIKPLYGKLRETWERFVEECLLNDCVQRFGREIQTRRLSKLTDITDADYTVVERNMSKCSIFFDGHDSAGALIEEMPDPTEFADDIKVLEDFAEVLRVRRR